VNKKLDGVEIRNEQYNFIGLVAKYHLT